MKKIDQEELEKILTDHRLWLDSDGEQGRRASFFHKDLSGANLLGADLRGANLLGADLCGAQLLEADLQGAYLRYANLQRADLRGANLRQADLSKADLTSTNLPLSIRDCYTFCSAKFSSEALPWLILHPKWSEWKDTVQIAAG